MKKKNPESPIINSWSRGEARVSRELGRIVKRLTLAMAIAITFVSTCSLAKADCLVLNTTPVSSLTGTVGPSITSFTTNVANTSLSQGGPATTILLGTFGPNLSLNPLTLTNTSLLTVTINLSGTGATLSPPSVNLVGTYDVALATFTFAPAHVSFVCLANDCGSFDIGIQPLALSTLLTGGAINASVTNVLCGTCGNAPTQTPEPATLTLMATGMAGIAGAARRRYRRKRGVPSDQDRAE